MTFIKEKIRKINDIQVSGSSTKILFIHPALRNYRKELFEKLYRKYDVEFIFVKQKKGKFGGIKLPDNWNYKNIYLERDIKFYNHLRNWLQFTKEIFNSKYEIILTGPVEKYYSLLAIIIAKIKRKKIIVWGESWHWPSYTIIQKIKNKIYRFMMKRVDAIIATGKKSQEYYKYELGKDAKIFYATKYVVPYQSKNPEKLLDKLIKKDKKIENKKIILYMSQIVKRKGLNYLIKAFSLLEKKMRNVYLLIVGGGPFEDYCKKLAEDLGVRNIMFTGYVPDEDIELYHNLCNVLVLPSIFLKDYPEPNGYVLYESMSIGKPLVVTNAVGAAPEYVQKGVNGFVVQEKNVEELYEALFKILTDETLEKEMGRKSKEIHGEKINLEEQYDSFKKVIEYTINKV